ncbi:MAG TPA: hypothetical protein PKD86_10855 [Gemmatales bacterium]|nr:hypothetical protein [Gemmatales bacterium]HMP59844.1 hypothetical protein [Gemmatales bacterium]
MARALEITVRRQHGPDGLSTFIQVKDRDGSTQTYGDLQEMPPHLRRLVAPILSQTPVPLGLAPESPPAPDEEVPAPRFKPKRRRARKRGKTFVIEHWWFDFFIVLGALAVTLFPIYLVRGTLFRGEPWTLWTGLALLCAALASYLLLAFVINRTVLTACRDGLTIWHGPLPWPGNRHIPKEELHQLYVNIITGRYITYNLCAITNRGVECIIAHDRDPERLLRYERDIEEFLGIADWPVPGSQYR